MIKNIRHVGIVTSDLSASLRFYQDLLGFRETKRLRERGSYMDNMLALKDVDATTVKLTGPDGQMIELLHFPSHPRSMQAREACSIGITHVAFTVENLDRTYAALSEAGIAFNAPPQLSPDGYAKVTFCKAPEGTLIELVEVL